jgi:hypothetical protein
VSRVRGLHPEFGYVGSFSFCRMFVAFVVCGLVAGAIRFSVFGPAPERDPIDAMALAPAETLTTSKLAQAATQSQKKRANAAYAEKTDQEKTKATSRAGSIKPTCRESVGTVREGDCTPVRALRVRPLSAVNERPPIAAVPIGQRDDPRVLAAPPTTPVAAGLSPTILPEEPKAIPTLTETSVAEATPVDAALAAEPTPPAPNLTVTSKKPRLRVHHAQHEPRSRRREHYSYASSYSTRGSSYNISSTYLQSGYARVW